MKRNRKDGIKRTTAALMENYAQNPLITPSESSRLPDVDAIIGVLRELRRIIFPGYFDGEAFSEDSAEYYVGSKLTKVFETLAEQIETALLYKNSEDLSREEVAKRAEDICAGLFGKLPYLQSMLMKDVEAFYDSDPAAKSREEIIFCYPGLLAIFVYRIAHVLYCAGVPFIPRIMTEHAHSRTGIDINSGAVIGEYFFIDHGTGIVIGETTVIGNHVKIYQGVTLGGISTRGGQALAGKKRHPTIRDNVTIYSGASILGGNTVIGENAVIGGNAFITESIPADTKVSMKTPELIIRDGTRKNGEAPAK